ncbi:MAG: hypothetical protein M1823_001891 [Watsoniomyces obsoletus]|nr:MAG: hypothetical protein M1823_001891 [Watsoniomyces obsoletus]
MVQPLRPPPSSLHPRSLGACSDRPLAPLVPPAGTSTVPAGRTTSVERVPVDRPVPSSLEPSSLNPFAAYLPCYNNFTLPSPIEVPVQPDRPGPGEFSAFPLRRFVAESDSPWDPHFCSAGFQRPIGESVVNGSPWALRDGPGLVNRYDDATSEPGSVTTEGLPCDSGYGTRSITSRSVFSVDIPQASRLPSIMAPPENSWLTLLESRDHPTGQPQSISSRRTSQSQGVRRRGSVGEHLPFGCDQCEHRFKSSSELIKHHLRHDKPYKCSVPDCPRTEGFITVNDLDRHMKCKHKTSTSSRPMKVWRCAADDCQGKDKSWLRLDNFRNHLKRLHAGQDMNMLVRQSEVLVSEKSEPDEIIEDMPSRKSSVAFEALSLLPLLEFTDRQVPNGDELAQDWSAPVFMDDPLPAPPFTESLPSSDAAPDFEQIPKQGQECSYIDVQDSNQDANVSMPVSNEAAVETVNIQQTVPVQESAAEESLSSDIILPTTSDDMEELNELPTSNSSRLRSPELQPSLAGLCNKMIEVFLAIALPDQSSNADRDQDMRGSHCPSVDHHMHLDTDRGTRGEKDDAVQQCPYVSEIRKKLKSERVGRELQATLRTDLARLGLREAIEDAESEPPPKKFARTSSVPTGEQDLQCNQCDKNFERPCALRKHMKRHDRPYGCTYPRCWKKFGSKNDWKRHENTQHFQEELWRCQQVSEKHQSSLQCSENFKTKAEFCLHLRQHHDITDAVRLDDEAKKCHIHVNGQSHVWCGFCVRIITLKETGIRGVDARFDHIAKHFGQGKRIWDWIPVDSNVTKGQSKEGNSTSRSVEVEIRGRPQAMPLELVATTQPQESNVQAIQDLSSSVDSLDPPPPAVNSTTPATTKPPGSARQVPDMRVERPKPAKTPRRKRTRNDYEPGLVYCVRAPFPLVMNLADPLSLQCQCGAPSNALNETCFGGGHEPCNQHRYCEQCPRSSS